MYSTPRILNFIATVALTQGQAVKFGADDQHVTKGALNTDNCIGVAMCDAAIGASVEVALPGGGGQALLGETVARGDRLVSHTDGSLVKMNTAGDTVIALAMESGVVGDIIGCEIIHFAAQAAE